MPKASTLQTAFNSGEVSPLMWGRVDFPKYKNALKTCINWVELVEGPLLRRPGTRYVAAVKDSTKAVRLVKFEFSITQAYILEFGENYIRVYKDHGQVLSGPSTPVEIVTAYSEAELFDLKFTQSADTLYIAHQNHAPAKLTRSSHTSWTLSTISFQDGPYLDTNTTTTTLTVNTATAGTGRTLTASAVTGINGGSGFQSTDVGRSFRMQTSGAAWGWGTITAVTDTTHATVTIVKDIGATTATATWRLGLWSDTTKYPGAVTFYEDRLVFGGSYSAPQMVNGSRTGAYENFAPTDYNTTATVAADHAYSFTLNSRDVQLIKWMVGDEKGLMVGTVRGEWILRPSSANEALSPTNVNAKQSTNYGSGSTDVLRAGKAALFWNRSGRKLREFAYDYTTDGFRAPNMTVLSSHISRGGVVDSAYQQEPHSVIWSARADGALLAFTYDREQDQFGWARCFLGGFSDADHTVPAIVESVAVIPEPSGAYDELWMVVRRWIGGASVRYIEYMTAYWEDGDDQAQGVYLDCSLTYDGSPTSSVSGADHLAGETVGVLSDGAAHPDVTVDGSGGADLVRESSVVHVGYLYDSDWETLRPEAGAADGTAQMKAQRTHKYGLRLLDSLGVEVGPDFDSLSPINFRSTSDAMSEAVPLFTGDKVDTIEGDYTTDNHICGRVRQPFPAILQALMQQLHTQDG